MSRWIDEFEAHAFHATWSSLKDGLDRATVDDETIVTSVTELARLKKVFAYLDAIIHSLDPELVPMTTWDTFNQQAIPCVQNVDAYISNRNITHIQKANSHADNLLTYIRPYMVIEGEAGKVLQQAVIDYAKTVDEYGESFREKSSSLVQEISGYVGQGKDLRDEIKQKSNSVNEYYQELLLSDVNKDSVQKKINDLVENLESMHTDVDEFYKEALVGDSSTPSTKLIIDQAKKLILEKQEEIVGLLDEVNKEVTELEEFHTTIFGKKEGDVRIGGLSSALDNRIEVLSDFEKKQIIRYNALNTQIESLLPGATSAGLATAYLDLKKSFEKPIKRYTSMFYASLGLLILASAMLAIDNIGGEHWVTFVKFNDWDSILKGLVYKVPFYAPVLWLAFFASKRRSELQRLEQEYAHKEALAKSYNSYKKQLEELDDEDKAMQKQFITKAIDAIAYNASVTLDGKHGDNMPLLEIFEKGMDKGLNIVAQPPH